MFYDFWYRLDATIFHRVTSGKLQNYYNLNILNRIAAKDEWQKPFIRMVVSKLLGRILSIKYWSFYRERERKRKGVKQQICFPIEIQSALLGDVEFLRL